MKIYESAENYLEAILMLSKKLSGVRSIDIAGELNFSKPSVSIAMKNFRENGFVSIDEGGYIHLTEKGLAIAERVYERHVFLGDVLTYLGVDPEVAAADACKIEHDLSDESFQRIKEYFAPKLPAE